MDESRNVLLPYRSEADELIRWVEARARGRSIEQIRALGYSAKNFEGTVATAHALGFLDSQNGELTASGRSLALAREDGRRGLIRAAIFAFEPYSLMLEALVARGTPSVTELSWIETWWATQGYGTSESNRAEGATVLARLLDYLGLGSYVQGRRGHPTRIEWGRNIRETLSVPAVPAPAPQQEMLVREEEPVDEPAVSDSEGSGEASISLTTDSPAATAISTLTVEFRPGHAAHLSVPSVLTRQEKDRLISILDLLISVEGQTRPR